MKLTINNITAFVIFLHTLISIRPFFTWIMPIRPMILTSAMLLTFLFIGAFAKGFLIFSKKRIILFIISLIFVLELSHNLLFTNVYYLPFTYLMFFRSDIILQSFLIFKKMIWYVSIFTLILFFAFLLGVSLTTIPYYEVEAFSLANMNSFNFFRIYGFVVTLSSSIIPLGVSNIVKSCGIFAEPGHFAVILGITYWINKIIIGKRNIIFIIAGLSTLSPVFVIILILSELLDLFIKVNMFSIKRILYFIGVVAIIAVFLSTDIVYELIIKDKLDNVDKMNELLDSRTNKMALYAYEEMAASSQIYFGVSAKQRELEGCLSDYRGFIFYHGLVGIGLLLIMVFLFSYMSKNKETSLVILLFSFIVIAHRSWMFDGPYLFILMLPLIFNKESRKV